MFEVPQSKEKSGGAVLYIVIAIVIVAVVGGAWFYLNSKDTATPAAPAAAAAAPQANADPTHDLRIVSSQMVKDYSGTAAMWTIELRNQSSTYAYSDIAFETTYAGADNTTLATNHGTIPSFTLGPGESEQAQFRDSPFPSATALFKVRITGATGSK